MKAILLVALCLLALAPTLAPVASAEPIIPCEPGTICVPECTLLHDTDHLIDCQWGWEHIYG